MQNFIEIAAASAVKALHTDRDEFTILTTDLHIFKILRLFTWLEDTVTYFPY